MTLESRPPRRSVTLKVLAGAAIGIAVLVLTTFLWINSVAERKWKEIEALAETLEAEARAREVERPVLRGTPVPGHAWDDYGPGLEKAGLLPAYVLEAYGTTDPPAHRDAAVKLLASHSIILEHLARGARKSVGAKPYDWAAAPSLATHSVTEITPFVHFAICQGRFLLEEGDPSGAIDVLLDGCQFIRDYADNAPLSSRLVAATYSRDLLFPLHRAVSTDSLSQAHLERLARALETLETHYPKIEAAYDNETLYEAYTTLNDPWFPVHAISLLNRARYGFSDRLLLADSLLSRHRLHQRIAAAEALDWDELSQTFKDLQVEIDDHPNPLVSGSFLNPGMEVIHARWPITAIRVLQSAIAFRLTGTVPALPDPFGTTLKHETGPGVLRIWSMGYDQEDKGVGKGSPEEFDFVIELEVKE